MQGQLFKVCVVSFKVLQQKNNPYVWSRSTSDLLPATVSVVSYEQGSTLGRRQKVQTSVSITFPVPQKGTHYYEGQPRGRLPLSLYVILFSICVRTAAS